jgi:hypothetical protein
MCVVDAGCAAAAPHRQQQPLCPAPVGHRLIPLIASKRAVPQATSSCPAAAHQLHLLPILLKLEPAVAVAAQDDSVVILNAGRALRAPRPRERLPALSASDSFEYDGHIVITWGCGAAPAHTLM